MARASFSNSEIDPCSLCFRMIQLSSVRRTKRVCCQTTAAGGERATRLHHCGVAVTESRCSLWLLSGVFISTLFLVELELKHYCDLQHSSCIKTHSPLFQNQTNFKSYLYSFPLVIMTREGSRPSSINWSIQCGASHVFTASTLDVICQ